MNVDTVVQILLTLVGAFGTYILYGMKEEMRSTREELTSLAKSMAVVVQTLDWHRKWLERHDDEIKILRDNN